MKSRARAFGHPIHTLLIVFPLGLLVTGTLLDVWGWIRGAPEWADRAFYFVVAGIIGGLVAAPFGLIDWLAIPRGTRAKAIGARHGVGNVVVLLLFGVGAWLRSEMPGSVGGWPLAFALAGTAVGLVTGWLGGELVVRLGVGVDPGAHLDAPSSLATEDAAPPGRRWSTADDEAAVSAPSRSAPPRR